MQGGKRCKVVHSVYIQVVVFLAKGVCTVPLSARPGDGAQPLIQARNSWWDLLCNDSRLMASPHDVNVVCGVW